MFLGLEGRFRGSELRKSGGGYSQPQAPPNSPWEGNYPDFLTVGMTTGGRSLELVRASSGLSAHSLYDAGHIGRHTAPHQLDRERPHLRNLIGKFIRLVTRHFLTFLFIVVVLYLGNVFQKEILDLKSLTSDVATMKEAKQAIISYVRTAESKVSDRVTKLESASLKELNDRISTIDHDLQVLSARTQNTNLLSVLASSPITNGVADHFKSDIEVQILGQEREFLDALRSLLKGPTDLAALRQAHVTAYANLLNNEAEQAQLRYDHPIASRVPLTWPRDALVALQKDRATLYDINQKAYESYERKRKWLEAIKSSKRQFEISRSHINATLQPLDAAINDRQARISVNWIEKVTAPAREVVPTAALILLAIILTPLAIKVVFYYVLAPIASRRPAIVLIPVASGAIDAVGDDRLVDRTRISSVSQQVAIDKDHELLIHPEYLQSSPTNGKTDTKWFLDYSYFLSSLASGMYALTRIRVDRDDSVVISATKDPLSEVGILSLPAGSSVVLQPRCLIGVLSPKKKPVRITSHWRLFSLHAWLTLQLRYLVFHGPTALIVKGCRGIRVENSGSGRRINQAATIGFSANVEYKTSRCETFASYLMGKQELLNDNFSGTPGFYIYEEMPHAGGRTGITGRGFEGLTDSILKVFGV